MEGRSARFSVVLSRVRRPEVGGLGTDGPAAVASSRPLEGRADDGRGGQRVLEKLPKFAVHVTRRGAWEFIREYGLLSTKDAVTGGRTPDGPVDVTAFIAQRRDKPVAVRSRLGGTVVINHNQPIQPSVLDRCLANAADGSGRPPTAAAFYRALNQRVFFWPSHTLEVARQDATTFDDEVSAIGLELATGPGSDRIWVDLHCLADALGPRIALSKYNSGSTPRFVKQVERYRISRGPDMWVRAKDWALRPGDVKEIAIRGSIVPEDLVPAVRAVQRSLGDGSFEVVPV